jgi:hypothetical protein
MTEPHTDAAPVKTIYARITQGAYDQLFVVDSARPQEFNCQDDHQTIVEVAAFDPERYETIHPVKLTCTATGQFPLTPQLDEAFTRLAAGELPKGSRSEATVKKQSYRGGVYHSYSLPIDQYPARVQDFMSGIFGVLYECASRVWRLLRWRSDAVGSHNLFQTILASEWSWEGQPPWYKLPIKGYARTGGWVIPQINEPVAYSVQRLLANGIVEPTSEELIREASALHPSNPRAGLLLAVAAAEVGFKELVIDLIPGVRWLALEAPSPPLVGLLKNSLPELPVRQGEAISPPSEFRNVMRKAVEARNDLAHQGEFNRRDIDLYEVIDTVRLLLRQFAYYRGFTWVTPAW